MTTKDDHSHGGVYSGVLTKEEHAAWVKEQDELVARVNRMRQERLAREAAQRGDPPRIEVVRAIKDVGGVTVKISPPGSWRPERIRCVLTMEDSRGNQQHTAWTGRTAFGWGETPTMTMVDRQWGRYAKVFVRAMASPGEIYSEPVVAWEPAPEPPPEPEPVVVAEVPDVEAVKAAIKAEQEAPSGTAESGPDGDGSNPSPPPSENSKSAGQQDLVGHSAEAEAAEGTVKPAAPPAVSASPPPGDPSAKARKKARRLRRKQRRRSRKRR